jgi:hypothetical protein
MGDKPRSRVRIPPSVFRDVVADLHAALGPQSSLATLGEKSSDRAKKIFVRNVWRPDFHSPNDRSEISPAKHWKRENVIVSSALSRTKLKCPPVVHLGMRSARRRSTVFARTLNVRRAGSISEGFLHKAPKLVPCVKACHGRFGWLR